ncbi:unnamed protein product, partial [Didymodactylos carnosus]
SRQYDFEILDVSPSDSIDYVLNVTANITDSANHTIQHEFFVYYLGHLSSSTSRPMTNTTTKDISVDVLPGPPPVEIIFNNTSPFYSNAPVNTILGQFGIEQDHNRTYNLTLLSNLGTFKLLPNNSLIQIGPYSPDIIKYENPYVDLVIEAFDLTPNGTRIIRRTFRVPVLNIISNHELPQVLFNKQIIINETLPGTPIGQFIIKSDLNQTYKLQLLDSYNGTISLHSDTGTVVLNRPLNTLNLPKNENNETILPINITLTNSTNYSMYQNTYPLIVIYNITTIKDTIDPCRNISCGNGLCLVNGSGYTCVIDDDFQYLVFDFLHDIKHITVTDSGLPNKLRDFIDQNIIPHLQTVNNNTNIGIYLPDTLDLGPYKYDRAQLLSVALLDTTNNTIYPVDDVTDAFEIYCVNSSSDRFSHEICDGFRQAKFLQTYFNSTPEFCKNCTFIQASNKYYWFDDTLSLWPLWLIFILSFTFLLGLPFLPISFGKLDRLLDAPPKANFPLMKAKLDPNDDDIDTNAVKNSARNSIGNYSSVSNSVRVATTMSSNIFSTKITHFLLRVYKKIFCNNRKLCKQRFSTKYLKRERRKNQQSIIITKDPLKDELDSGYSSSSSIDSENNSSYTEKIIQHRISDIIAYPIYDNSKIDPEDENSNIFSPNRRRATVASTNDVLPPRSFIRMSDEQRQRSNINLAHNYSSPTIILTRARKQDDQQQNRLYVPKRKYSSSPIKRSISMDRRHSRKDISTSLKPILSNRRSTTASISTTRGSIGASNDKRRSLFSLGSGIESLVRLDNPRTFDDKTVLSSSFKNENTSKLLIGTLWNTFALVNNLFLQKARKRRDALTLTDLNADQLEYLQRLANLMNYYNQDEETDYESNVNDVDQQEEEKNTTYELETIMHALQQTETTNLETILSDLHHPTRRFSSTNTTPNFLPKQQSVSISTNTLMYAIPERTQENKRTIQIQTDIQDEEQQMTRSSDETEFHCMCHGRHKKYCIYYDDSTPLYSEIRRDGYSTSDLTTIVKDIHMSKPIFNSDHLTKIIADIHQDKQRSYASSGTMTMKDVETTTDLSIKEYGAANELMTYTNAAVRPKSVKDAGTIPEQLTILNASTQYSPLDNDVSQKSIISEAQDQSPTLLKYPNTMVQDSLSEKKRLSAKPKFIPKDVISKSAPIEKTFSHQRETVVQELKRALSIRNTPAKHELPQKSITQTEEENLDFENTHTVRSLVSMFESPEKKSDKRHHRRSAKIKNFFSNSHTTKTTTHRQQTPIIEDFLRQNPINPTGIALHRQQTPSPIISEERANLQLLLTNNSSVDREMLINQYSAELASIILDNAILTISRKENTDDIQTNNQSINTDDSRTPRFSSYKNGNGKCLLFQTHTFVPNVHKSSGKDDEEEMSSKHDTDTNTILDTIVEQSEMKPADYAHHTLITEEYVDRTQGSVEEQNQQVKDIVDNHNPSLTRKYQTRSRHSVDDSWRRQYDRSSSSENESVQLDESNSLQYLSKSQQFSAQRIFVKPWLKRRMRLRAYSSVSPDVHSTDVIDSKVSPTTDDVHVLVHQLKRTKSLYHIIEEETFPNLNTHYASLLAIAIYVKSVKKPPSVRDDVMLVLHSHLNRIHQTFENNFREIELLPQTHVFQTINNDGSKRYKTSFIVDVNHPSNTKAFIISANEIEWKTVKVTVRRFRKKFSPPQLDIKPYHTNQTSAKLKSTELIEFQPHLKHFDNISQHRVQKYAAHYAEKS